MFSVVRQACFRSLGAARGFSKSAVSYGSNIGANLHKVNNLEKRFLVWTGKYKTIIEVPDMVPGEIVERARNRMRIRIANIMMGTTLIACLAMAISGKRAHERGESVQKENAAWHNSFKETK